MILYTPAQLELVFGGSKETPRYRTALVDEIPVLVRETGAGCGRIERILSTDPADYLRSELSPGTPVVFEALPD